MKSSKYLCKYLFVCEHVGAIVDVPFDNTSEEWHLNTHRFIIACGKKPGHSGASIHSLYDDQSIVGIYYNWGLAGPDGANFEIIQMPHHGDEQIAAVKDGLRRSRDVVHIRTIRVKRTIEFQWQQSTLTP